MSPTDYQRRSPEYAQYYYARAKEDNQRAYDQQQRAELAKWAKTSGYLGNEGQQGLPSADPALQTQPGTGIYTEGFNPDRREMMLRNQQMLMSENDAMQAQGMSQMGGMQDSRNTGVNQIDMEKWKKDNIPRKADTKLGQLFELKASMDPSDPRMAAVNSAITKESTHSKLVDIDMGDDNRMSGVLTPEHKDQLNLDPNSAYVWNNQGIPTAVKPSSFSDVQLKSGTFAERMENSRNTVSSLISTDFDPTQLIQYIGDNAGVLGNYTLSDQQQMFIQASHDWIRAKLRKESGAVIAKEEMQKEYATYFPMPGDSVAVMKQKAGARKIAEKGMARESGGAFTVTDEVIPDNDYPQAPAGLSPEDQAIYDEVMGGV
tara:strand:- start:9031 stop:10152 length:1122 start_codon:yes stop_codon:yes gene_type:complete